MDKPNAQLGNFLRQRRERLRPEQVGLKNLGRRRTPGLRREEVAELANISTDWYVRLEQGRQTLPSQKTIEALAKALRLTESETAHLITLATGRQLRPFQVEKAPASLQRIVKAINLPAYVIGQRWDIVAWNDLAADVYGDFGRLPKSRRNLLRFAFTDPEVRERLADWEYEARHMVARFRETYDLWSHDPAFTGLVDELMNGSPEFSRWWQDHAVSLRTHGHKAIRHPKRGSLLLEYATFQSNENPDLCLILSSQIE